MNAKLCRQLRKRNLRIRRRIDKREAVFQSPAIHPSATKFELSEKSQAISCGGIGIIMQMIKQLDLRKHMNEAAPVFKLHLPYDEADHVFNIAIELCKKAGFRKIRLRGDTDFSSTTHLDRWDQDGVTFVLGYDANKTLVGIADSLPQTAWKTPSRAKPQAENERAKRPNYRERIAVANKCENQILQGESYAEFDYQSVACERQYRMVVVRKDIKVMKGKACGALTAPLNTLESNWVYMVMASLAWTLKLWSGMLVRVKGNPNQRQVRAEVRRKVIRMEFSTYLNSLMLIPAQVLRSARQLKLRLLAYRRSVDCLLTLSDHIAMPLRC